VLDWITNTIQDQLGYKIDWSGLDWIRTD